MSIINKEIIKDQILNKTIVRSFEGNNLEQMNNIAVQDIINDEGNWSNKNENNIIVSIIFVPENAGNQKIEDFIVNTITVEIPLLKFKKELISEEKIKELFLISPETQLKFGEYKKNVKLWSSKEIAESEENYNLYSKERRNLERNLKTISEILSKNNILLLYLSQSNKIVNFRNKRKDTAREILTSFEANKTKILKAIIETTGQEFNNKLKNIINRTKELTSGSLKWATINELSNLEKYDERKHKNLVIINKLFEQAKKIFNIIDRYIGRTDTTDFSYKEISEEIKRAIEDEENIYTRRIIKKLEQNKDKQNIKAVLTNENGVIEAIKEFGVKILKDLKNKIKKMNLELEIVKEIESILEEIKELSKKSIYNKIFDSYIKKFNETSSRIINKNKNIYSFNYNALLRGVIDKAAVVSLLRALIMAISFASYYLENRQKYDIISYNELILVPNRQEIGGIIKKSVFKSEVPSLYEQITQEQFSQTAPRLNEEINETIEKLEKEIQNKELWVFLRDINEYLSLSLEYISNLGKQIIHYLQITYGIKEENEAVEFIKNSQDPIIALIRNIAIETSTKQSKIPYEYIIKEIIRSLSIKEEKTVKTIIEEAINEIKRYNYNKEQTGHYNELIRTNLKTRTSMIISSKENNLFKKLIIDIVFNTIDMYKLFSPIALGIVASEKMTGINYENIEQLKRIVTILNSKDIPFDKKLALIDDKNKHQQISFKTINILDKINRKQGIIETIYLATDIIKTNKGSVNIILQNNIKSIADLNRIITVEKENYIKENFNELGEFELQVFEEFEEELRRWWNDNSNREVQKLYNYKGAGL